MSKKRQTRGILGMLKPARPMLFTFQPNEANEWPSEDESDSDFEPTTNDRVHKIEKPYRRKRKKNKQHEASTSQSTDSNSDAADDTVSKRTESLDSEEQSPSKHKRKKRKKEMIESMPSDDAWGVRIPLLALVRIFSFVIAGTGAVPLLCRLSRVCRLWKQAAGQPMLWQHVDLANSRVKMTDHTVQLLATTRLTQLRDISFSGWTKLTDKGLQVLLDHCPHLKNINLTRCISLTSKGVKSLAAKCHSLKAINLSLMGQSNVVSPINLKELVELLGDRLEHLVLTQNKLKGCPTIMKAISTNCRHLKTLDLCNCKFSTDWLVLPIEELQTGCPDLGVLRLTGCKVRAQQATSKAKAESPGFVHLSELSLAVSTDATMNIGIGIDDQFMMRILKNSRYLKLLDLRGLTCISSNGLENLTVDHLEHLYISQSKYVGIEKVAQKKQGKATSLIIEKMAKWRHSLVELDLSWNVFPAMSLDVAMNKLSSGPSQSMLKHLNLSGTSITADRVRSILQGCPNLTSLNLTSCRGLPRGMKRLHDRDELKHLGHQLRVTKKR